MLKDTDLIEVFLKPEGIGKTVPLREVKEYIMGVKQEVKPKAKVINKNEKK